MSGITVHQNPAISNSSNGLSGSFAIPGDKSISHRSLIIASQLLGTSTLHNMLESEDVIATATALRQAGVTINHNALTNHWTVNGVGIGGLQQVDNVVDMGNSGTSTRLLCGLFAPYPYATCITGDASLRKRPMKRVITPLSEMGATFMATEDMTPPFMMKGTASPLPITYRVPMPSAQVKSCIMLAALNIPGETTVIEPIATRDHTERMFQAVGFPVTVTPKEDGTHITVTGCPTLHYEDREFHVPGDPSSAAFPLVAALITQGSDVVLSHICMNETRIGIYHTLRDMGADIAYENERIIQGETVADVRVKSSALHGITVLAERAPSMIDEYPILAVAAACASGITHLQGLEELRVKESDRFSAIVNGLRACGVQVDVDGDNMSIHGQSHIEGGATVTTHLDHRIAMSFLVLGLKTEQPVTIDDSLAINTSFPSFLPMMQQMGASIEASQPASASAPLVIALDGTAASGKGTLARKLADYFDLSHLDTGGLYRAAAMKLVTAKGNPDNKEDAIKAAQHVSIHDLSNPRLREEDIGNIASMVSAMPEVRDILLEFQRNFARQPRGAILDGRDIGTVVCPQATVKIFMTASIEARAKRRHTQLQKQGIEVVYESVLEDLVERDARDMHRPHAPLVAASDAIHIDTTNMTISEVYETIIAYVEQHVTDRKPIAV